MKFFDGERVDVVPSQAPVTLYDYEVCFFENAEMLHDGTAVQLPEAFAQLSGGSLSDFEQVEYFAPPSVA